MIIYRTINGETVGIELTDDELIEAGTEQYFLDLTQLAGDHLKKYFGIKPTDGRAERLPKDQAAAKRLGRTIQEAMDSTSSGYLLDLAAKMRYEKVLQARMETDPEPPKTESAIWEDIWSDILGKIEAGKYPFQKKEFRTLLVDPHTAGVIENYLNATCEDEYQDEDDVIRVTAKFDNGYEMDIKCCGSQDESSWTEAVLFRNGCEVCSAEPGETFFGEWELEHDGTIFHVDVHVDKLQMK